MNEEMSFLRRARQSEEGGTDSWLMSYADMITLLLCFFIIFVSTSEPKEDKLAAATSGMKGTFGTVQMNTPFIGAFKTVEGIIERNQAYQSMSVEKVERGVQVELSATVYFKPDSAELEASQEPTLVELAQALKNNDFADYTVTVAAYTDDVEPSAGFASNWELSSLRASRMARFLAQQGFDPLRLHTEGYGAASPKVPNRDADGNPIPANQERNRRLVIRVERAL